MREPPGLNAPFDWATDEKFWEVAQQLLDHNCTEFNDPFPLPAARLDRRPRSGSARVRAKRARACRTAALVNDVVSAVNGLYAEDKSMDTMCGQRSELQTRFLGRVLDACGTFRRAEEDLRLAGATALRKVVKAGSVGEYHTPNVVVHLSKGRVASVSEPTETLC